ncbi:radical SAM/SPASM domain-containing protein [Metaclostridioides mangenotii]|uniref:radical SAM/SPASM domain-containing protein n=1 Tax=Metaclostridioides mangenotii TaxID=1540 RepID=UPI0026EA7F67|nr:radical SAM protein [Clostridioides mangenotii]
MKDKYFLEPMCDFIKNGNVAIVSNKFTGKWIKIPKECCEVLIESYKNSISLDESIELFERDKDKIYFLDIIDKLDKIGVLDNIIPDNTLFSHIPKIMITLTNRCNLRCDYCCVNSGVKEIDELTTDEFKLAIDNILRFKPKSITISGGEPMLRDDFYEILDYLNNKYNGNIILATNATLIKIGDVDKLAKTLYALEISLDGYDEESCSEVRGAGVFTKVKNVIELMHERNFQKISLSMVVGKNNISSIDKFYKLNDTLKTKACIRPFSNIGRGEENSSKYLDDGFLLFEDDRLKTNEIISDYCNAGNSQLSINCDGSIYVCQLLEEEDFYLGNVLEVDEDFIDCIYNKDFDGFNNFEKLKTKNMEECKDCNINIFCGICPAIVKTLKSDKQYFSNHCKNTKKNLASQVW